MVKTVTLGQHSSRVGHSTKACPLHEVTKIVAFPTGCCLSIIKSYGKNSDIGSAFEQSGPLYQSLSIA